MAIAMADPATGSQINNAVTPIWVAALEPMRIAMLNAINYVKTSNAEI